MSYRYLGNKSRIADWIVEIVSKNLKPGDVIADLMCGTATMSERFATSGYKVIAGDQLLFPVLHAKARLSCLDDDVFDKPSNNELGSYVNSIRILNDLKPVQGFFWKEYSDAGVPENGAKPRKYFTSGNAMKIDAIREQLRNWRSQGVDQDICDLLLHDLILASNKVANIAGTFGYYKANYCKSSLADITLQPSSSNQYDVEHEVIHGPVEETSKIVKADAVYLDPPYTKRQYAGNYHIPETLAQEDEPVPQGEGGLRDWQKQASDFCYKRNVKKAFYDVISNIAAPNVFISYSEDGQIQHDDLIDILGDFGKVSVESMPLERYRSNSKVKSGMVEERLYILEK
ncbi:DNA adenine methylase [Pseudoalteromonas piscicida]|uniref:site-specific DNA-methyltransferase (adenine-specific) n=1 Tax=Pseudoalteromonas piscicida TaxID=43662 RepID=A0A2A5JMN1_PSEO7|nr:DNA adenine methylase [Pseudoalteromonas piscicida]PCK30589.1 hypothetical protein CEX98_16575 [Pseudoalteromonas piscicida]